MKLELKSGQPKLDGLYLVFVDTAMHNGWKEPHIVLWHNGRWNHRNSSMSYKDPVYLWTAIPVMSADLARSIMDGEDTVTQTMTGSGMNIVASDVRIEPGMKIMIDGEEYDL